MTAVQPWVPPALAPAAALERLLGDPWHRDSAAPFERLLDLEDAGEFPREVADVLAAWGFSHHLVPVSRGGRLGGFDEVFALCRSVARRDITLALGYGSTLLASLPVWQWGTDAQCARVAELVLAGRFGSFALSEQDHGSDLLANEVHGVPDGDGFLVSGEKWPIGNATRGAFASLFVRTAVDAGAESYSLLLLDKEKVQDGWCPTPAIRMWGTSGHDLSGFRFDECRIGRADLLGAPGHGLEQTLRTLQINRSMVGALSLGAADTALRVAVRYATGRRLYGKAVATFPVIREALLSCYADILIGEATGMTVARAITIAPERLSLWSSISKYLVPTLGDDVMAEVATVMGARRYVRDEPASALLQKMQQDVSVAAFFEGTTHVNLQAVIGQLPGVLDDDQPTGPDDEALVRDLFSWSTGAPPWTPTATRLRFTNRGRDEITQHWPKALAEVTALAEAAPAGSPPARVLTAMTKIDVTLRKLRVAWRQAPRNGRGGDLPASAFASAKRFCLVFAAACCVHLWLANRQPDDPEDGALAALCLERLLVRLGLSDTLPEVDTSTVEERLLRSERDGSLFSVCRLGPER
ncbi:acyl-CoA dehydrogenase [Kibdelosporangium lantanae]